MCGGGAERNVTGPQVGYISKYQFRPTVETIPLQITDVHKQVLYCIYKSSGSEIRPTKIGPQEPTNLSQLSCTKWPDK